MCSSVTAVGRIMPERRMTAKPWEPRNAQQFPGLTSGYEHGSETPAMLSPSESFFSTSLAAGLEQQSKPNKTPTRTSPALPLRAHLQDDTGGLRVVPQGDAEQAQQRCPCLVGLRAASVDDAGPWHEGMAAGELQASPCVTSPGSSQPPYLLTREHSQPSPHGPRCSASGPGPR